MRSIQAVMLAALFTAVLAIAGCRAAAAGGSRSPDWGESALRDVYVSPAGSDESGDGTIAAPWQTPGFAASMAKAGDTIHLAAGIYTLDTPIELPPGVSLEGEGDSTVLTSLSLTEELAGQYALLRLVSPLGEEGAKAHGNQHVSHILFDGAHIATQAIEVQNRCFVAIHDCVIVNFAHVGVGWRATDLGDGTPPAQFVTGGRFYNNYMKDNSFYGPDAWGSVYGRGALFCGGLQDFEICGNSIIEDCRTGPGGRRGVPIKFWYYDGWMVGCRIHNNVIERLGSPTFSSDEAGWAFAIESMFHAGMEICDNDFIGAVDLNNGRCGSYGGTIWEYATWLHDNRFTADPEPKQAYGNARHEETAIILEARTERTIVERNAIRGYNQALYFNVREGVYDFAFRHNRCENLGGDAGSMFRLDGIGSDMEIVNFSVTDNLLEGTAAPGNGFGIILGQEMGSWTGRNIRVAGNAVAHTLWNWLVIDDYTAIDGLAIENNTWYDAGGDLLIRPETEPVGFTDAGNEEADSEQWLAARKAKIGIQH